MQLHAEDCCVTELLVVFMVLVEFRGRGGRQCGYPHFSRAASCWGGIFIPAFALLWKSVPAPAGGVGISLSVLVGEDRRDAAAPYTRRG